MMHGLTKTEIYQSLDKGQGDGTQIQSKNVNARREILRIKWKLFLCCSILLTSIFVFTGTVIYLNFNPLNNCRRGCLNVHIIPYLPSYLNRINSHQDYGMDQSFDFVLNELEIDERRRFTITEVYPFWKWWKNQTDSIKGLIRNLINEGRIEIAGGGWVIPDEPTLHYRSFIDQFTYGLRRVEEISGRKISPDVSFLIDNRGHSKEIASLIREMDFRGVLLGGISPIEQCYRKSYLKMEFLWSDGDIFGVRHEKPNLLTSIMEERALKINEYFSNDKPVIDINKFVRDITCLSQSYITNNIFIPISGNFQTKTIKNTFRVIDSLMNLTKCNSKHKLNMFYSTPSNYLNSINYNNENWWRSNGEFLPYVQGKFDYWTGYYSSLPSFKYYQRVAERFLQVLKQMITLSNREKAFDNTITNLIESVALSHHHSVPTSPFGQNIADYFQKLFSKRIGEAQDYVNQLLRKLTFKENTDLKLRYESCLKLNISECPVTETSQSFIVTVYNPSHRIINQYIRVPVTGSDYMVRTSDGKSLTTQILRIPKLFQRKSNSEKELIFRAMKIPPLGFKSYYVSAIDEPINKTENTLNKKVNVVFDKLTGKVSAIIRNGEIYPLSQELKVYKSWLSNNVVFRPENKAESISDRVSTYLLNDGELITEYQQHFGFWASQIIRVYADEDFVEFNWILDSVPVSFFEGKEMVTSFTTNIRNENSFFVDLNGRRTDIKFKKLGTENENNGVRIASNYAAVNTRIGIADREHQLHIFNDRAQGGTSSSHGQLQLMVHRKFMDLTELNEKSKMEMGQHWLFLGSNKDADFKASIDNFSARLGWEPWYFFADSSEITFQEWRDNHVTEFCGVRKKLPKNLRILTLEPWAESEVLLRLENIGQDNCDKLMINLQEIFSGFAVTNATQVSLNGNRYKEPATKFACNPSEGELHIQQLNAFIYPSQIKTFILTVKSD